MHLNGGDRKSLTPANNLAVNNHVHHYGLFQRTYAPGIGVQGCGQTVRHNCIHDAPHNAVLYGGNEHLFELNEVYRVVMETGDAGAFYENLAVNTTGAATGVSQAVEFKGFVNLAGTASEPIDLGFSDPAAGNFAWRPNARLRKELPAFEEIPFETIGLYQDEYRHRLPAR